ALQLRVAVEVSARAVLVHKVALVDVDQTERGLEAQTPAYGSTGGSGAHREGRDGVLMPMIVRRVEDGHARGMRRDDVAGGVEDLLGCVRALVVGNALEYAGRDLSTTADLQRPGAEVPVRGRKAE